MNINLKAFLDMIAVSEGTAGKGDDGYNVLVGGKLFDSYKDHPRVLVDLPNLGIKSSAAGRYQVLRGIYDNLKGPLGLTDFSPESQDKIAIALIQEKKAISDIEAGRIDVAVEKCKKIWASFPGAGYGQYEHKFEKLQEAYLNAGGTLST